MDGSVENGMAIKMAAMAERSEERHGNPSSENSSKTAIAIVRENSKIQIKASKIEQWLSCKMAKGDRNENG